MGRSQLRDACAMFIPELADSEDERIRKHLVEIVELYWGKTNDPDKAKDLAYLEKQKEQKPVISDEAIRDGVAHFGITQYQIDYWLKKHINVVEQKSAEWSEEDERHFNTIIRAIHSAGNITPIEGELAEKWLKSRLCTWKPTEEQMEALRIAYVIGTANESWAMGVLKTLYSDLKKFII